MGGGGERGNRPPFGSNFCVEILKEGVEIRQKGAKKVKSPLLESESKNPHPP